MYSARCDLPTDTLPYNTSKRVLSFCKKSIHLLSRSFRVANCASGSLPYVILFTIKSVDILAIPPSRLIHAVSLLEFTKYTGASPLITETTITALSSSFYVTADMALHVLLAFSWMNAPGIHLVLSGSSRLKSSSVRSTGMKSTLMRLGSTYG